MGLSHICCSLISLFSFLYCCMNRYSQQFMVVFLLQCLSSFIVSVIGPYSWLLLSICIAYADVVWFCLMLRICSLCLALRLRPVCPTYHWLHVLHLIPYIPLLSYCSVCWFPCSNLYVVFGVLKMICISVFWNTFFIFLIAGLWYWNMAHFFFFVLSPVLFLLGASGKIYIIYSPTRCNHLQGVV
jgi:hypothetical protein